MSSVGVPPPAYRLPAATRLGAATLLVTDLGRSIDYYEQVLGLRVAARHDRDAALAPAGGAAPLLHLRSYPGVAASRAPRLGLYHFALLVPNRPELGRFVSHLVRERVPFASADHAVSEAIYLRDPDGLGIEVYRDRPRDSWRMRGGELYMTTEPLDLAEVVAAGNDARFDGLPAATVMGHMHLQVGSLKEAEAFYHRALGFDKIVWSYPGALFLSAGGYHHHLGTNTWAGLVPPRAPRDTGLLAWEIVLPTIDDIGEAVKSCVAAGARAVERDDGWAVADPWGTELRLVEARSAATISP